MKLCWKSTSRCRCINSFLQKSGDGTTKQFLLQCLRGKSNKSEIKLSANKCIDKNIESGRLFDKVTSYLENNSTSHNHTHSSSRKTHMHNFPNAGYGYGHCVGRVRAKGGTYKRCLCARQTDGSRADSRVSGTRGGRSGVLRAHALSPSRLQPTNTHASLPLARAHLQVPRQVFISLCASRYGWFRVYVRFLRRWIVFYARQKL